MLWLSKLRSSKILHSSQIDKELPNSSYALFKFRSDCLVSTICLFTLLYANMVLFSAITAQFSVVMFMIECRVTQSGPLSQM